MASTYSSDLKLELMATGENAGTWGTKTNANLNLIQQSVAGYQAIDVASGDVTLAMTDATISNARNMTLEFTGTLAANRTVNFPASLEKVFNVIDSTNHAGYTLTFKVTSAAGFLLCEGNSYFCHSNGTNIIKDLLLDPSDAADDLLCIILGCRRRLNKHNTRRHRNRKKSAT